MAVGFWRVPMDMNYIIYGILVVLLGVAIILLLVLLFRRPLHKARAQDAYVAEAHKADQTVRNSIAREIEGVRELLARVQNSCASGPMAESAAAIRKASDALDQLKRLALQAEAGRVDPLKDKQVGVDRIEKLAEFDRSIGDKVKALLAKAESIQSRVAAKQASEIPGDVTVVVEMAAEISRHFREREKIVQG
jgi:hypothetical protein